MKPKQHVFICMNRRPEGHPRGSCQSLGASETFDAFAREVEKRDMFDRVLITGTFCMGPCDQGPTVVVYPDGVWYKGVAAKDVPEIFDEHFDKGTPVERLRLM